MNRLNNGNLASLPGDVVIPRYNRREIGVGIVHLGVGAFHRAHQAYYTEKVLNERGGDWGIIGASLRSVGVRDQMQPQDGLYTLVTKENDGQSYQVIGAIKEIMVGPEAPGKLISHMASPGTRVISLTITEKGYCHDPANGHLHWDHPGIQRDFTCYETEPVTAIGYLVASLARRKSEGSEGVTLLSCDNLPNNGKLLRRVIMDFVGHVDVSLAEWIDLNVTFPCTMVDRIVPATTDNDLQLVGQALGISDLGAVVTEPFCQWVIENKFAQPVPDWKSVGALIVEDVSPFEEMKLRLLNGSHSIIAYLGYLAGYDYVHDVMADENFYRLIRLYMDEQATPTLDVPEGFDLGDYKQQLRERFANRALNHKTSQIAQDGSQKIPQRWINSVRELEEMNRETEVIALAVAGWIRYLEAVRDTGETFVIEDPMSAELGSIKDKAEGDGGNLVNNVLSMGTIFGDLVDSYPRFVQQVEYFYCEIKFKGVQGVVKELFV